MQFPASYNIDNWQSRVKSAKKTFGSYYRIVELVNSQSFNYEMNSLIKNITGNKHNTALNCNLAVRGVRE